MKNIAKGLPFLPKGGPFEGLDMHSTSSMLNLVFHSPFNRFGFITPNKWNTFQQLHTTSEAMVHNNRMKELIRKNKFKHRLGPGGYKAKIPL
jgi:hypothetical protein